VTLEGLSPLHLIIVLVIAVLVLGPGKLPEVGAALGKTIREFRKATSDMQESVRLDASPAQAPAALPALAPVAAPAPQLATVGPGAPAGPSDMAPPPITPTSTP
jgi:sec-independent protein translocase protein TatA